MASKETEILNTLFSQGGYQDVNLHPGLGLYIAVIVHPKIKRAFIGVDADADKALVLAAQDFEKRGLE